MDAHLPSPPVTIEPRRERQRQPHEAGPTDERMLTLFLFEGGVRVFYQVQLPRELASFGAAVDNDAEDDNVMSTAASESRNWSTCLESEASHSKVCEPLAPVDEELLRILTEVVQDLGLDWSPLEQPASTCGFCSRVAMLPPPRDPLYSSLRSIMRSRSLSRDRAKGLRLPSSVDRANTWGTLSRCPSRRPSRPIYVCTWVEIIAITSI